MQKIYKGIKPKKFYALVFLYKQFLRFIGYETFSILAFSLILQNRHNKTKKSC